MIHSLYDSIKKQLPSLSLAIAVIMCCSCQSKVKTSFTSAQSEKNAALLARVVENYAWTVDPEIYFSDDVSSARHFLWAPRLMKSYEYRGSLTPSAYGSTNTYDATQSRLFSVPVPLVLANAFDSEDIETRYPAQFCMLVTAYYKKGNADYLIQFLSPSVADDYDDNRLIYNGRPVAQINGNNSAGSLAIPVTIAQLGNAMKQQGLPVDFPVELYDSYRGYRNGTKFMVGSAYITIREARIVKGYPDNKTEISARRLKTLQVFIKADDDITAEELYSGLLKDNEFRTTLSKKARDISTWNRSQGQRAAAARDSDERDERARKRSALRRRQASANKALVSSLNQSANELSSWQRQQSQQSAMGYSNYSAVSAQNKKYQQEIDEKLAKAEVQGRIDSNNRKLAAMKREQAKKNAKLIKDRKQSLERDKKELEGEWTALSIKQVLIGRTSLKKADIAKLESQNEQLKKKTKALNRKLKKDNISLMNEDPNKMWYEMNNRTLAKRAKGTRRPISLMHAPMGEKWEEHLAGKIDGIEFYQRVRKRNWPDKAVDLTWRVVNTTDHPYWHSLTESKAGDGQFYLWGGSTIKPGKEHTHVWVTYKHGRSEWKFEGYTRRED